MTQPKHHRCAGCQAPVPLGDEIYCEGCADKLRHELARLKQSEANAKTWARTWYNQNQELKAQVERLEAQREKARA